MQDLTGATQGYSLRVIAFLLATVLMLPAAVSAQEPMSRPTDAPATAPEPPAPSPTPTPTPTPTESEEAGAPEPPAAQPTGTAAPTAQATTTDSADGEGLLTIGGALAPQTPGAEQDATAGQEGGQVQAEGNSAVEVAAAPLAPGDVAPEAPVEGQDVAAAGDEGVEPPPIDPAAADVVAPPPIASYGPQVVPSLGTASAPNTNTYTGFEANAPLVLAPEIAGQPVAPGAPITGQVGTEPGSALQAALPQSGIAAAVAPVRNVAAASLSIVQPSWFATTFAMVILLVAASYGAVLRRRGEIVPDAIAFSRAVRPSDATRVAVRSVRPGDLAVIDARSIRP